ncbi:G-protein coupled receptor family C group 5 member D [Esox lucius]|uniref:G-protein coupled receptors family 3 profile domain-containing protein n=1 Tax=Esox lucius TaxID=8010 RepID=A0A3P8XWK8_ESOLU|nr:G-protein coupled receptor family C group 5 member D [Esox lucius]
MPSEKKTQAEGRNMWTKQNTRKVFPFQIHKSLFLLLLCPSTVMASNTTSFTALTNSTAAPFNGTDKTAVNNTLSPYNSSTVQRNSSSTSPVQDAVPGCAVDLDPRYSYLCDRRAAWGIVVESLATLGFLVCVGLLVGLLFWNLWACVSSRSCRGVGGGSASVALFLIATAGIFALTFAFIVRLTPQTCPTRLFLFGVLFSLAFSCLLVRGLVLLGWAVVWGLGEAGLALALFTVQVVIATEWLIIVLLRDGQPCQYSQGEFVMLLIYVLVLLATGLVMSLCCLCHSCNTYSYGGNRQEGLLHAGLLGLTLTLSAAIWVVWIALLTRGNLQIGRRPQWDDPVLSIALVANGWVLLLGHGLAQVALLCSGEASSKDGPLDFGGWISPDGNIPSLVGPKEGRDNGSFENDGVDKGGRRLPALRSPYESGFSMTEIDPEKDYSIPRPQTTNISEPYPEYYGHSLPD